MADELFIGIDSGTQGCKVVIFSREFGRIVSEAYSPHSLEENEWGKREQDPSSWVEAMDLALRQALQQVHKAHVRGIGVSGQQHGLVALDQAGEVIRPAKLWCDTQTEPECALLMNKMGGVAGAVEETGNAIATGFTASKLLWMKLHEPENYEKLHTILLPHDYLNFVLTGNRWMEHGDASGTGFYTIKERNWSSATLQCIDSSRDLSLCLPPLIKNPSEPGGTLKRKLARQWGLPEDVVVSSGGGDNMMAAIGTGNVRNGVVSASLGTSGTLYGYSPEPVIDPQGELAAFCSSTGGWLPLVCTMNVTVATELVRKLFGYSLEDFNQAVDSAVPGAQGILLLPFFNGERTPALPSGCATLTGMNTTNFKAENISRAAMEGVSLGLRYGIDLLKRNGMEPQEIRLVGGGAKSRVWREMLANILNTAVISPITTEAAGLGAALQALWCYCSLDSENVTIEQLCEQYITLDPDSYFEPEKSLAKQYSEIYERYLYLEKTTRPLYGA